MLKVNNSEFQIGDLVYLKTDPEQRQRIVTGILTRPTSLIYYVSLGDNETIHYDIEISKEQNINHLL